MSASVSGSGGCAVAESGCITLESALLAAFGGGGPLGGGGTSPSGCAPFSAPCCAGAGSSPCGPTFVVRRSRVRQTYAAPSSTAPRSAPSTPVAAREPASAGSSTVVAAAPAPGAGTAEGVGVELPGVPLGGGAGSATATPTTAEASSASALS